MKTKQLFTFIVLTFAMLTNSAYAANKVQGTNGHNVTKVIYKGGGNKGIFSKSAKSLHWIEKSRQGGIFKFTERLRDAWSVYLYDKSRDVHIQLDLHRKKVIYSQGNSARSDLYNIIKAIHPVPNCGSLNQRPCSVTERARSCKSGLVELRGRCVKHKPQVKGYNVQIITHANQGSFAQIGKGQWAEYNNRGQITFKFVERNRDEWSVYLYDQSRDVNIQLDLHRKKVRYSTGRQPLSDLYQIISAN